MCLHVRVAGSRVRVERSYDDMPHFELVPAASSAPHHSQANTTILERACATWNTTHDQFAPSKDAMARSTSNRPLMVDEHGHVSESTRCDLKREAQRNITSGHE